MKLEGNYLKNKDMVFTIIGSKKIKFSNVTPPSRVISRVFFRVIGGGGGGDSLPSVFFFYYPCLLFYYDID